MKKLLPILVVVLLLVGGGGYYAYGKFLAPAPKKVSPALARRKAARAERLAMRKRERARVDGPTVSLGDDFLVNLADPGLAHFAKFDVMLKVDKATKLAAAAEGGSGGPALDDQAAIRDIVIEDAGRFSAEQLVEPAGRERLKRRIIADVAAHTQTLPLDVYFTSFAVQ